MAVVVKAWSWAVVKEARNQVSRRLANYRPPSHEAWLHRGMTCLQPTLCRSLPTPATAFDTTLVDDHETPHYSRISPCYRLAVPRLLCRIAAFRQYHQVIRHPQRTISTSQLHHGQSREPGLDGRHHIRCDREDAGHRHFQRLDARRGCGSRPLG